jgi:hypothetical protein
VLLTQSEAAKRWKIPRTTLRSHLSSGKVAFSSGSRKIDSSEMIRVYGGPVSPSLPDEGDEPDAFRHGMGDEIAKTADIPSFEKGDETDEGRAIQPEIVENALLKARIQSLESENEILKNQTDFARKLAEQASKAVLNHSLALPKPSMQKKPGWFAGVFG